MKYVSTRAVNGKEYTSAEVIKQGLADDGGLFVPAEIPRLNARALEKLCGMDYPRRAAEILSLFLTDYSHSELLDSAEKAYSAQKFGGPAAPIARVGSDYYLELWHGPTSAFKDMALQIMPRLLSLSLEKTNEKNDALILVATSGDTGKAALEGFCDVPRVNITVFYPQNGVSAIQKKQMRTQKGENVSVVAVNGNFDDAQTGVKRIFADPEMKKAAAGKGLFFSSANSINWGRLAPQIVYYISAYCDLVNDHEIAFGEKINVTVPTGNFGNILACLFAKKMGLPVNRLVCASNRNDVLTQFINTGVYDKRREFHTTVSPSMDILISSNLERLLWLALGAEKTAACMRALDGSGFYSLSESDMQSIRADFAAFSCGEEQTKRQIKSLFDEFGYLCDTHTAVAAYAAREYAASAHGGEKMLVVSTASPYKFAPAVLSALGEPVPADDFKALEKLHVVSSVPVPANLSGLESLPDRFSDSVDPDKMANKVFAR